MKKMIQWLSLSALLLLGLTACEKDENRIYAEGGTAPVLTANRAASSALPMSYANREMEAVKLMWTNPNYMFTSGVSSQDVNYNLEIDTAGKSFTSANKKVVSIAKDLMVSMTQGALNDYLLTGMKLNADQTYNVEMRLISTLANSTLPLTSNTMRFQVRTFSTPPKVDVPTTNELFITGSATPASWMSGGDAPVAAQKFTRVSNTLYRLASINLSGGNSALFVPKYGDWGDKYGFSGGGNANKPEGDDLKRGGNDIKVPAASGNYKVEVDFQLGTFTFTKL